MQFLFVVFLFAVFDCSFLVCSFCLYFSCLQFLFVFFVRSFVFAVFLFPLLVCSFFVCASCLHFFFCHFLFAVCWLIEGLSVITQKHQLKSFCRLAILRLPLPSWKENREKRIRNGKKYNEALKYCSLTPNPPTTPLSFPDSPPIPHTNTQHHHYSPPSLIFFTIIPSIWVAFPNSSSSGPTNPIPFFPTLPFLPPLTMALPFTPQTKLDCHNSFPNNDCDC